jgi:hypothetical protein
MDLYSFSSDGIFSNFYWLQATWQPNISTMAASPATAVVLSSGQLPSALKELSHEVIS